MQVNNSPTLVDQILDTSQKKSSYLHLKPLSHYIALGLTHAGTNLQQSARVGHWHGRAQIGFAKFFVGTGYVLNTLIATIEAIAIFAFAALAIVLHTITRGRSLTIHKITLKLCAYFINTHLVMATQIICLKRGIFSRYHSLNAVANHTIHAAAALIAQVIGHHFDKLAGRVPINDAAPSIRRSIHIIIEIAPRAIQSITKGAMADFTVHVRENQNNVNLRQFLEQNPNYREILNGFTFHRVRTNAEYRESFLELVGNYLVYAGILNANLGGLPETYDINNHEEIKTYQNSLKMLIKESFIKLYDNEKLVCLLSQEKTVKAGRIQLTSHSAIQELATYTQLQEIKENENTCPKDFKAHELQSLNNRQSLIEKTKKNFKLLKDGEEEQILEKTLRVGEYDLKAQDPLRVKFMQSLFNDIGTLAGQLYQGPLMTQKFVDLSQLNSGDANDVVGSRNLFQGATEAALEEIEQRKRTSSKESLENSEVKINNFSINPSQ